MAAGVHFFHCFDALTRRNRGMEFGRLELIANQINISFGGNCFK